MLPVFFITILFSIPIIFAGEINIPLVFESPNSSVSFQQVSENVETGDYFVMDQFNNVYRFPKNLSFSHKYSHESPIIDAAPLRSQVLLSTSGQSTNRVLACGMKSCGMAIVDANDNWMWQDFNQAGNVTAPNIFTTGKTIIAAVTAVPPNNKAFYFIATEDSGISPQLPVLSVREYDPNSNSFSYRGIQSLNALSALNIIQSERDHGYRIKPVFLGFTQTHGYFVSVHATSDHSSFVTKIGRFCLSDNSLGSYVEANITCSGAQGVFSIATSGSINDKFLSLVFGRKKAGTWDVHDDLESAVCTFSLDFINQKLDERIDKCSKYTYLNSHQFSQQRRKVAWVKGRHAFCVKAKGKPIKKHDMCERTRVDNPFIDANIVFKGASCMVFHNITALQVVSFPTKVSKVPALMFMTNELLMVYELLELKNSDDLEEPGTECSAAMMTSVPVALQGTELAAFVQSDVVANGTSYIAMHQNKIQSFPIGCGIHATCDQCITSPSQNSSLGCGWCEDSCTTETECLNKHMAWRTKQCSPIIIDFSPKNGSLLGNTIVTIRGENFGSVKERNIVDITGSRCQVLTVVNSTELSCKTISVALPVTAVVNVEVNENRDLTKHSYTIHGRGSSKEKFSYLATELSGFSPVSGPAYGNTTIIITGNNFLIGNELNVNVASRPCQLQPDFVTNNRIVCRTSSAEPTQKGPVEILIDGGVVVGTGNQEFNYCEEPFVKETKPTQLKAIMSGYNSIQFFGGNFKCLSGFPYVTLVLTTDNNVLRMKQNCSKPEADDELHCRFPALVGSWSSPAEFSSASLELVLDPEANRIDGGIVWRGDVQMILDPVASLPGEEQFTGTKETGYVVSIKGERLDEALTDKDYNVTVDDLPCPLEKLSDVEIRCRVNFTAHFTEKRFFVKLHYSGKEENLGEALFVTSVRTIPPGLIAAIIVVSCVSGVLIVLFAGCYVFRRAAKRRKQKPSPLHVTIPDGTHHHNLIYGFEKGACSSPLHNYPAWPQIPMLREIIERFRKEGLIIDEAYLKYSENDKLGSGHFGTVYSGFLLSTLGDEVTTSRQVAIKTIPELSSAENLKNFLSEAANMKNLIHENVMPLLGICLYSTDGTFDIPRMVMPLVEKGDLRNYVLNTAISYLETISFASQIAEGMAFLAMRKIIHRDLAARNCMLDDTMNVKIADFGLSRDIYQEETYVRSPSSRTPLPIRWTAPECVRSVFTTKSDVWSYGVVIWEMLERGALPYAGYEGENLIGAIVSKRLRLHQPDNCPDYLYELMQSCWNLEPDDRPDFPYITKIVRRLFDYLSNLPNCDEHSKLENQPLLEPIASTAEYLNDVFIHDEQEGQARL